MYVLVLWWQPLFSCLVTTVLPIFSHATVTCMNTKVGMVIYRTTSPPVAPSVPQTTAHTGSLCATGTSWDMINRPFLSVQKSRAKRRQSTKQNTPEDIQHTYAKIDNLHMGSASTDACPLPKKATAATYSSNRASTTELPATSQGLPSPYRFPLI